VAVYTPFAAGQRLTAGGLNTLLVQETMPWTNLATLGSFGTNFSAGAQTPQMRKFVEAGTEMWEFRGTINASAFAVNTVLTMFTLSVATPTNRVASEREFSAQAAQSGHYSVRLGFMTNGTITASVPAAAPTTTSVVWLDCQIISPLA
jgi:hypothetical protein